MADPFDEFEFKPLTEGLGFHKKNKKNSVSDSIHFQTASIDLLGNDSPLQPPLPRNNKVQFKAPEMDEASAAVEEILQTLRSKKSEPLKTNVTSRATSQTAAPVKYKPGVQNISAFILDAMLVLAATLLCMIVVLSITKVDVTAALFNSDSSTWIYLATMALFGLVTFIYLVGHRIFLGATPGEWAYDQRIGHPEELGTASYAISVIARAAIVVLTGIITLPLISIFMKRDLVGALSLTQILERA